MKILIKLKICLYLLNYHDVERYNDVLEIQQQLVSTIEAASKDYSPKKIEEEDSKEFEDSFKVDFIADREIMYKMIELIELAKKRDLIASPWIWASKEVLDSLKKIFDEKQNRVRIVTRTANYEKDELHKDTVLALFRQGSQIVHDEKVHAKLLLC